MDELRFRRGNFDARSSLILRWFKVLIFRYFVRAATVDSDVRSVVGVHLTQLWRDVLLRFDHCFDALRKKEKVLAKLSKHTLRQRQERDEVWASSCNTKLI